MPAPCEACKETCGGEKAACGDNCKCGPSCACGPDKTASGGGCKGGTKKCGSKPQN